MEENRNEEKYWQSLDPVAEEGVPLPAWSVENHLKFMADAGIDYSILSLPTPHVFKGEASRSRRVVRAINEEMAELCRRFTDQFGFVAALPLPFSGKVVFH